MKNQLPKWWSTTTVGEIAVRIHYGHTAKASKEPIGPKFLRITDIQDNRVNWEDVPFCKIKETEIDRYLLEDGDIVFARTGATVGKSFLIRGEIPKSIFASYLIRINLSSEICPEFVFLFFQSHDYWQQISEGQVGIGQPNVNGSKLSQLKIPIPPASEQKRIVSKIEELFTKLDAGEAELKKAKQQIKLYKKSILKSAVEGKLTEEWRKDHQDKIEPSSVLLEKILKERKGKWEEDQLKQMEEKGIVPKNEKWKKKYPKPNEVNNSSLPDLPQKWKWVTYNQVGLWIGGGTPSKRNLSFWNDGQIPWVSPKDMKSWNIETSLQKITQEAINLSSAKLISKGAILFVVRSGILRRTLPVALSNVDVTVNQDLRALSPVTSIDKDYLLTTAKAFGESIRQFCAKDGTTVESIEVPLLQEYPIPLPSLLEQKAIVKEVEKHLSIAEEVEATIEVELKKSKSLKQSILKKAFSGKLVPQNLNDEPASSLIEKIKKEKTNFELKTKASGKKTSNQKVKSKKTKKKKQSDQLELI